MFRNTAPKESKASLLTDRGDLYDYEISRIPCCVDNRLSDGG
jgi:hypothetical protein